MGNVSQHIDSVTDGHEFNRQISIWLDKYDDIFSDFDRRAYSDRALSDDFMNELKKVCREETLSVGEMKLLVPEKNRKQEVEATIVKRLHSQFRRIHAFIQKRVKIIRLKGVGMVTGGLVMLSLASLIASQSNTLFFFKLMLILFEPAGWFFMWTGLDNLFVSSSQSMSDLEFYTKLSKSKITFSSY